MTASEDHTLKLWNLQRTVQAKKSAGLDVEPLYTFRAHTAPVLCLAMGLPRSEECFSGGLDGTIRVWNLPPPTADPYDPYDPAVQVTNIVLRIRVLIQKIKHLFCERKKCDFG